jgi:hypothetical protein
MTNNELKEIDGKYLNSDAVRRHGDRSMPVAEPKWGAEEEKPRRRAEAEMPFRCHTVGHLLREEKQGTTALRISFKTNSSRSFALCDRHVTPRRRLL